MKGHAVFASRLAALVLLSAALVACKGSDDPSGEDPSAEECTTGHQRACYGGAAWLFARRLAAFAHAAVLAGIAVYGASIMLIAQMYHMEGNPPDAVLMWALGALLAAPLTVTAIVLVRMLYVEDTLGDKQPAASD